MKIQLPSNLTGVIQSADYHKIDGGKIYFGQADKDPRSYPIDTFLDNNLTVASPPFLYLKMGYLSHNGNIVDVYVADDVQAVSILITDVYSRQLAYLPSVGGCKIPKFEPTVLGSHLYPYHIEEGYTVGVDIAHLELYDKIITQSHSESIYPKATVSDLMLKDIVFDYRDNYPDSYAVNGADIKELVLYDKVFTHHDKHPDGYFVNGATITNLTLFDKVVTHIQPADNTHYAVKNASIVNLTLTDI